MLSLLLLFAISCHKEKSTIQHADISRNRSVQDILTEDKAAAGSNVRIGTQVWMTKNLDVKRYRNGQRIPQVTDKKKWAALTTGAWCWYNNDSATYASTYGRLYNWYAVNDPRGLAPAGWHVPSDVEWTILTTYLGGPNVAGGAMKETGIAHWNPNYYATNSSGFTGLLGGFRNNEGTYVNLTYNGYWWSNSEVSLQGASCILLTAIGEYVGGGPTPKSYGCSVRCVKD